MVFSRESTGKTGFVFCFFGGEQTPAVICPQYGDVKDWGEIPYGFSVCIFWNGTWHFPQKNFPGDIFFGGPYSTPYIQSAYNLEGM